MAAAVAASALSPPVTMLGWDGTVTGTRGGGILPSSYFWSWSPSSFFIIIIDLPCPPLPCPSRPDLILPVLPPPPLLLLLLLSRLCPPYPVPASHSSCFSLDVAVPGLCSLAVLPSAVKSVVAFFPIRGCRLRRRYLVTFHWLSQVPVLQHVPFLSTQGRKEKGKQREKGYRGAKQQSRSEDVKRENKQDGRTVESTQTHPVASSRVF